MTWHQYVAAGKGGPEALTWQPVTEREIGERELGVRVEAAGVLLADVLWQLGITPVGPKHPFTPGYDLVGVVEAAGAAVTEFAVGQRVAALVQYGGYTEYAYVPVEQAVAVPAGLEPVQAAAATTSYLAAYSLVQRQVGLQPGQAALIHGAGGGTGLALVEMALRAGARVYGTASKDKHALVTAKGGFPIDYQREDFVDVIQSRETSGVRMVVDPIGGDVTPRSLGLLGDGGQLISIAMIQAIQQRSSLPAVMLALLRLPVWSLLHPGKKAYMWDVVEDARQDPGRYRQELGTVFQMIASGELTPVVGQVMPLRQAPEAQLLLLDYAVTGRLILVND